jgi:hypothetical protein
MAPDLVTSEEECDQRKHVFIAEGVSASMANQECGKLKPNECQPYS